MTLDSLDNAILQHLQRDARQANALIARAAGVREATVRRRIENLLRDEVLFLSAVPEPDKFGFQLSALVGFSVAADSLASVSKTLINAPEIVFLGSATGRFDLIAEVVVRDLEDLLVFLARLARETPEVTESEALAFLKPRSGEEARISAPEFSRPGSVRGQVSG